MSKNERLLGQTIAVGADFPLADYFNMKFGCMPLVRSDRYAQAYLRVVGYVMKSA